MDLDFEGELHEVPEAERKDDDEEEEEAEEGDEDRLHQEMGEGGEDEQVLKTPHSGQFPSGTAANCNSKSLDDDEEEEEGDEDRSIPGDGRGRRGEQVQFVEQALQISASLMTLPLKRSG